MQKKFLILKEEVGDNVAEEMSEAATCCRCRSTYKTNICELISLWIAQKILIAWNLQLKVFANGLKSHREIAWNEETEKEEENWHKVALTILSLPVTLH